MNYLLFLILGLFWSGSFLFIKISVLVLPPIFSAFLRVLVAQIAFTLLFLVIRQGLRVKWPSAWRLWVIGVFLQGLPFLLLFTGECYISPALASIINGTVSIWALIFNILIFKDFSQATLSKVSGLFLGICGVLFIFIPAIHSGHDNKVVGALAVTGMAMSYAIGAILNQRFCHSQYKVKLQASLWHQHWGSLVFLIIMVLAFEPHLQHNWHVLLHTPMLWTAFLYLGIGSTTIAWFIYCHLIQNWGAVRASSVMFIVPILTIIWDDLFLHLSPTLNEFYGITIILTGVALIQFTKKL